MTVCKSFISFLHVIRFIYECIFLVLMWLYTSLVHYVVVLKVSQTFVCSIQQPQGCKKEHATKYFITTDIFPLLAYLFQVLFILSAWGSRASKKYKSPIWGKRLTMPTSFMYSHLILETGEFKEILWNWKIKRQRISMLETREFKEILWNWKIKR